MKKSCLITFGLLFCAFQNFAQSPFGFNYQAALRNNEGEVAANSEISLRFSLHAETFDGEVIYQKEHVTTTSGFGLMNVVIKDDKSSQKAIQ